MNGAIDPTFGALDAERRARLDAEADNQRLRASLASLVPVAYTPVQQPGFERVEVQRHGTSFFVDYEPDRRWNAPRVCAVWHGSFNLLREIKSPPRWAAEAARSDMDEKAPVIEVPNVVSLRDAMSHARSLVRHGGLAA